MNPNEQKKPLAVALLGWLSFFLPFALFFVTRSSSLMFDDAAEFTLVAKLGSIAHAPGTPAFIFFAMYWQKLLLALGIHAIDAMNVFAALCVSTSSLLLFLSFNLIAKRYLQRITWGSLVACAFSAIGFATAATTWAWSNTVEVYSFQVLAMAVALHGLIGYHFKRSLWTLAEAAIGISFGLAAHHVTMIFFLPFVPFFFLQDLFLPAVKPDLKKDKKAKKNTRRGPGLVTQLTQVFKVSRFWLLTGSVAVIMLLFYYWMYLRAQQDYPFMFGKPDTLDELIFHMRGGAYTKNITGTSASIMASRIPYFLELTFFQLLLLLPFFVLGLVRAVREKIRFIWIVLPYFLFLFAYQVNNDQWSSTDAYMLLPFMLLGFLVFYGVIRNQYRSYLALPLLVVAQAFINFPANNRKSYPVSESLMTLLDESAPKNSIIIISDWTTVMQYYYYRLAENFRPDLVVLNYDLKFTHYRILPTMYPEFYEKIKPQYDHFIEELKKEHPYQAVNTGCDLSTRPLSNSFKAVITRMEELCRQDSTYFLTDPKAHYFYSTEKFYNPNRFVSGCFSSSVPGDSAANAYFTAMDFPFLESPLLTRDPAALDKLVDFQAMLDWHMNFYKANGDERNYERAKIAHDKVMRLQREMRREISFAYKLK